MTLRRTRKTTPAARRRRIWAEAKTAAHAYACNPCAATVREVERTVDQIRHLNEEAAPRPSKSRREGQGA